MSKIGTSRMRALRWLFRIVVSALIVTVPFGLPAFASSLGLVRADLNESVLMIPADASASASLETTIFRPEGNGPFPLVVFNHGRDAGDPHSQPRSRPLAFAREFVRRGYVVAIPNRRGFAQSTGAYEDTGCDLEADAFAQARDIAATVSYLSRAPYVDPTRIVIAGVSHGGFASLAYGTSVTPAIRGIINFSGGLRKDQCSDWRVTLTNSFSDLGARNRVPSLWFYGSNDRVFDSTLVTSLHHAFTASGGNATLIDYGRYKDDAHGLVGDRDAVKIWWPATERFLAQIGMPATITYQVEGIDAKPRASGFARLDAVDAVPYLDDAGRIGYLDFLSRPGPRVFALSRTGRWAWAAGGDDPLAEAISNCSQKSSTACKAYAIDDLVVWKAN